MAYFQDARESREPFLNAPASVLWLIAGIVAAHAVRVLAPLPWPEVLIDQFAFIPARLSAEALEQHGYALPSLFDRAVPFISYIFLHGSWAHLLINSLWLLAFGPIVMRRLGTPRFLGFFLVCGVAAAAAHLAVEPQSFVPVVGASGSISGLMGAAMRILYGRLYSGGLPSQPAPLAPLFSRAIAGFSLIWVIGNVVTGIIGVGVDGEVVSIAWVAHLGGYFCGLVLIGAFDRFKTGRPASA